MCYVADAAAKTIPLDLKNRNWRCLASSSADSASSSPRSEIHDIIESSRSTAEESFSSGAVITQQNKRRSTRRSATQLLNEVMGNSIPSHHLFHVTSWQRFQNPYLGYSVNVPSSWQVKSNENADFARVTCGRKADVANRWDDCEICITVTSVAQPMTRALRGESPWISYEEYLDTMSSVTGGRKVDPHKIRDGLMLSYKSEPKLHLIYEFPQESGLTSWVRHIAWCGPTSHSILTVSCLLADRSLEAQYDFAITRMLSSLSLPWLQ